MRIITGLYKGKRLKSAAQLDIRPVADRVKETIFNILNHRLDFEKIRVLDLFAGTGSLGLEALSRGAAHITFVDFSKDSVALLNTNIELLGCFDVCNVVKADSLKFIERCDEKFDLIFAAPPYAYKFFNAIPNLVFEKSILNTHGFLLVEHPRRCFFEKSDKYNPTIVKEFGNTTITFFIHNKSEKL